MNSSGLENAQWLGLLHQHNSDAPDAMWTSVKLNDGKTSDYGFGWSVGHVRGHRNISHGGGMTMGCCSLWALTLSSPPGI